MTRRVYTQHAGKNKDLISYFAEQNLFKNISYDRKYLSYEWFHKL